MGFEDRQVAKISGHRNVASLAHYDPNASVECRANMAAALLLDGKPRQAAGMVTNIDFVKGF